MPLSTPNAEANADANAEPNAELRSFLRSKGAVIDPVGMKSLYAPWIAQADEKRDPSSCEITRDLAYGSHARHRLDVYRPSSFDLSAQGAGSPVVVFVHGGGFMRGDKSERAQVGHCFADQGWLTVIPNYRLTPESQWPSGAQDVAAVCQWLLSQWPALAKRPLLLVGESAGAAHVATALLCQRFSATQGWANVSAALISGTYHPALEAMAAAQLGVMQPDVRNQAYFGADVSAWAAQSLVDLIDAKPFPLLITYAELDPLQFQVGAGELFAKLVRQHGFKPQLHLVRGHNHLSQVFAIGTADDALTQRIADWADEINVA
jgi:triacylglycerol lipase